MASLEAEILVDKKNQMEPKLNKQMDKIKAIFNLELHNEDTAFY